MFRKSSGFTLPGFTLDCQFLLTIIVPIIDTRRGMKIISTRQAAKRLGLHFDTLSRYVATGKLPAPTILEVGSRTVHAWTDEEIETVRKLLPKIANGRKTRYQKVREKQATQSPALHKNKTPKKKK